MSNKATQKENGFYVTGKENNNEKEEISTRWFQATYDTNRLYSNRAL
jgi:hypothetical protein